MQIHLPRSFWILTPPCSGDLTAFGENSSTVPFEQTKFGWYVGLLAPQTSPHTPICGVTPPIIDRQKMENPIFVSDSQDTETPGHLKPSRHVALLGL